MSNHVIWRRWIDTEPPRDVIQDAISQDCDYIHFGHDHDPEVSKLIEQSLDGTLADVLVVIDPNRPARRRAIRESLPPLLSLIAALPDGDVAVALSVRKALICNGPSQQVESVTELALRMSEAGTVRFVEQCDARTVVCDHPPQLTMPATNPRASWLSDVIQHVRVPQKSPTAADSVALKAGLLLLHDFFEESHACSQSIEGQGSHRAGDFWHAILHRREPDYGNAKYWFRHVGRHPIFDGLAQHVTEQISTATGSLSTKLQRWQSRLISPRGWDPFAFVDLCEAAFADTELKPWCEAVQYEEMLRLLESTYRDAVS